MDVFRVRLNCIDHYQAIPTKYDPLLRDDVRPSQLRKEPRVPVIRVFGSTETGQKVCAHIHGALPYLYVEYRGSLHPDEVNAYIYRLHLSIDHALAVSYRRNVYDGKHAYVARITLVKGIPFYGFYVGYRFYLKIYMLNPMVMTRLAELLWQGLVMKQKFQPYEAHLQYLLQFMTDYNLYGCGYIDTRTVRFRSPVPQHEDEHCSQHLWHSQSVSTSFITDDPDLPRVSHCSIEVDICVQDILNRHEIKERHLHHDFIERLSPMPNDVKLVHSMAGLWKDETRRRKRRMPNPAPGSSPFPAEVLISMSADPRDSQPAGWIHEEEYRDQISELVREESERSDGSAIDFDSFVQTVPFESTVNTLLQSVEDLYPDKLASTLTNSQIPKELAEDPASSIVVDEDGLHHFDPGEDDLFPDDSDEEALVRLGLPHRAATSDGRKIVPPTKQSKGALDKPTKTSGKTRTESGNVIPRSDVTASSTKSDPKRHLNGIPEGVQVSCLRTGNRSSFPISRDLVNAAKQHGLVSKTPYKSRMDSLDIAPSKRSVSPTPEVAVSKRRRVEFQLSSPSDTSNGIGVVNETTLGKAQDIDDSYRSSSQADSLRLRRDTSKQTDSQRLNFQVVKDPKDPNTILRLSQTSSQRSNDGEFKKHVSFDTYALSTRSPTRRDSQHSTTESSISSTSTVKEKTPAYQAIDLGCEPRPRAQFFLFAQPPPLAKEVLSEFQSLNRPDVIYQGAYYSKEKDVPSRAREFAGQEFRLEGNTLPHLPDFDATGNSLASFGIKEHIFENRGDIETDKKQRRDCSLRGWEISQPPPSHAEVKDWWAQRQRDTCDVSEPVMRLHSRELNPYMSQIDGSTPKNKHGFKYSQKRQSTSVQHEAQYMSTMSLEIHVNTRKRLVPNPEEDEVQAIFWCSKSDENCATGDSASLNVQSGVIVLSEDGSMARAMQRLTNTEVIEESSELDLMVRMVEIVRTHDPDILTGYEVHGSSWGFLVERARLKYDYNLCDEFSRMKSQSFGRFGKEADKWGFNTTSTIRVTGRHMINIWRAMRGELNLLQYTMENVVWHLLHRRIPHYPWHTLTEWYTQHKPRELSKLMRYYLIRTKLDIEILETNELIPRTSEQARLLGVDFFSVFSRGSQFKVESIMFRIAKPENFILVSPDRKQVGQQNALECLPLVMEPQSAFYNGPLLVLDFQSLYPSVMIAYNYCYSTFLGRIVNWRNTNKMGFTEYSRQKRLLELLKDYINIAPNGIMYCKTEIRKSLLAKMLTEILETRVMVKSGMKQDKGDKTLQQLLNNRQLALKLLANVTYGYTSASFSGRMPCSEIADSIVQTGRETLERAIAFIHSVDKWRAEVVYGDTDSIFVYLPGRTKDQAFDIGNEIAKRITDMNPRPIKLKFEKVYHPCVLLAKKRYVGYKYESKDQVKPDFDAKGIETVRRDGTPAEQMIEEKALKVLFETADLSQVKSYFQRQCAKIMRGAVSIQDFCFAKEVKLGTYSERGPPPPGALISTKKMLEDARAEPQYGERVPYVVVSGAPGARLIDRCVAPEDLLSNSHLQLDAEYYISKNLIPPLERIFNLVGAHVRQWYDEMPKIQRIRRVDMGHGNMFTKKTLESYMKAASCVVCGIKTKNTSSICNRCQKNLPASLLRLQTKLNKEETKLIDVNKICQSCAGLTPLDEVPCDSKDCPMFYTRMKQVARYRTERSVVKPAIEQLLSTGAGMEALEW